MQTEDGGVSTEQDHSAALKTAADRQNTPGAAPDGLASGDLSVLTCFFHIFQLSHQPVLGIHHCLLKQPVTSAVLRLLCIPLFA